MKNNSKVIITMMSVLLLFSHSLGSCVSSVADVGHSSSNLPVFSSSVFDRSVMEWSVTEVVTPESTAHAYMPSLIVDNEGNKHVVWNELIESSTSQNVFYKRYDSATHMWLEVEQVSNDDSSEAVDPFIALDEEENVHVVWRETGTDFSYFRIFYRVWNSSNSSWSSPVLISTESTGETYNPSLAVDAPGNVHIAWHDSTNYNGAGTEYDIFYKCWNRSTTTWSTTSVVSTESTSWSRDASLATDLEGNVHVAWRDQADYDGAGYDRDIFYKCWNRSTATWSTTSVVSTESTTGSSDVSLATDLEGNVHVAWQDSTNYTSSGTDPDIFYKCWISSSATWSTTDVVSTESSGDSDRPSLTVDGEGNVHVVWEDLTNYGEYDLGIDIFYKYLNKDSALWSTREIISPEGNGSWWPFITMDPFGSIHVTWVDESEYDGSGGDMDIFTKTLVHPPSTPVELAFIMLMANNGTIQEIPLQWDHLVGASTYYIYRASSYIWSVDDLIPIGETTANTYIDVIDQEGYYYYSIVAGNVAGNGSYSNCQYTQVILTEPTYITLGVFLGAIGGLVGIEAVLVAVYVITKRRK